MAVQADPGLRVTAAGLGERSDGGEEGRRDGFCYPWDQNTSWVAGPLDDVSFESLQQRSVAAVNAAVIGYCPRRHWGSIAKHTIGDDALTLEVDQPAVQPLQAALHLQVAE